MSHEQTTYTKLKAIDHKRPLFELIPKGIRNPLRGNVKNYLEQGVATVLIFIIFFVIMNWSAISQTIAWEFQKASSNVDQSNELYKLVEKRPVKEIPLPLAKTSTEARKLIPGLNFNIAPPDTRLIIPRINRNVPVVNVSSEALMTKDWDKLESDMQGALRYGVIHYPGTAYPGQPGNIVVTGHSSYFPWDPGRFKDVFAVLHDMRAGDKILLYHNQQQYIYEVDTIKKIWPSDLNVLRPSPENKLTLITCTPLGTNIKRLIVEAKLIGVKS